MSDDEIDIGEGRRRALILLISLMDTARVYVPDQAEKILNNFLWSMEELDFDMDELDLAFEHYLVSCMELGV